MSDFVAGPPSGGHRGAAGPSNSGPVGLVLLAGLAATLFIGVILMAVSITAGGGGGSPASVQPAAAGPADAERVVLNVFLKGQGKGEVRISPGAITCGRDCEHRFAKGTRLTVTTNPADGSAFDRWGGACKGDGRCSFAIEEDRSLTVTFKPDTSAAAGCDDRAREVDPACADGRTGEPLSRSDCHDGRDNDRDGLTDAAQDPDCDNGFEAALPAPAPPPPPAAAGDCDDGRDNDGDGLTDTKQDPDCLIGDSESAAAAGGTTERRPTPDCSDGRDNDGDGLTDTEQDPGCDSGGTEAD